MPYGLVAVSAGIGIGLVALGIAYLVMAYGLWRGKRWAWTITMVLSFIGVAPSAVSIVTGNIADNIQFSHKCDSIILSL